MTLYLHPSAKKAIAQPLSHATLLTGQAGVGLHTIALEMTKKYENLPSVRPELLSKTSTVPQIGVDAIRSLYQLTRGKSRTDVAVIIDDADMMTDAAQHSFLKLLEEPNESTHFILTSHHPELLLATVRSRLQTIHIPNISDQTTLELLDTLPAVSSKKRQQLLFTAKGLPAELLRLSGDEAYFKSAAELMMQAKSLLQETSYGKLVLISKLKTQRLEGLLLIEKAIYILINQPTTRSITQSKRLLDAYERISAGGNVRLQLLANML